MSTDRIVIHKRYRVVTCIGRGGMGAVYGAIDERLGIMVAVKESFATELELRSQFEREARLLASLRHPALPRVTDYFIEGGHAFLVMELVAGPTLADVLNSQHGKPFETSQVIKWADQVLDVLVYLHGQEGCVIHRDIKPHNLKLNKSGGIWLIDFGLAKVRSDEGRSVHGFTRRYAPIEQIEDRGTTAQSDIYALGATLYHLLTGIKPADAEVRGRVVAAGGEDPLASADSLLPAIGPELAAVLTRALARCAEDRFASANDFREALRRIGRASDGGIKDLVVTKPRRRWLAMAACLIGVAVIVALVAGVFSRGKEKEKFTGAVSTASSGNSAVADLEKQRSLQPKASNGGQRSLTMAAQKRSSLVARVDKPAKAVVHPRVEVVKVAEKSPVRVAVRETLKRETSKPAAVKSDEVLRAPDGTEVVKFRDGRVRAFQAGERRQ